MNSNIYWSIFKNIEREVVHLSNQVHFDDDQLKIYSVKIAELLIRTCVELESISKDLYLLYGGVKPNNNELYFDTDCIQHLESKWKLSCKKVFVASSNFYFELDENKILLPLNKANKRGTSSCDWLRAYQAVKHNRSKNFKKGNLKHLLKALAGLFLLNIYYRNLSFNLDKDASGGTFEENIGSEIFAIKTHSNPSINIQGTYQKKDDFDECTYLIIPTEETKIVAQNALVSLNNKAQEEYEKNVGKKVVEELNKIEITPDFNLEEKAIEIAKKFRTENLEVLAKRNGNMISKAFKDLKYKAILNVNQF
ncbi:hypothetical protein [Flagellimonas sp.]|uniref:hypothetical protein n=1 Tax=Flagellimonas sp. TaxID=2058762 RepID=UPI003AB5A393